MSLNQSSQSQSVPISTTNVNWVDVDILKADHPADFLQRYYFNNSLDQWDLGRLNQSFTSVFTDRYTVPNFVTNEIISSRIKIPTDLKAGWYVLVLNPAGNYASTSMKFKHMLLTDIGIQAKLFKHDIHVRAAKLSDGKVLSQGKATLYRKGKPIESTQLNQQGEASFSRHLKAGEDAQHDVIIIESGDQMGILALRESPLDLSEFAIGGLSHNSLNAFVYSNRDLIRPGDDLPIHILLRDQDGQNLPAQPLNIRLVNSKNAEIFNKRINPSRAGYYSDIIQSQMSWPMGYYTLEVRTTPKAKPIQSFGFQIEEFTPERMELAITEPKDMVYSGHAINYSLYGKYLFGTPASDNKLTSSVTYQPVQHFSGKYRDFYVGEDFHLRKTQEELKEVLLDDSGLVSVKVPTPTLESTRSPIKVSTNFSLLESGGAAVQREHTKLIWKNSNIPAIRPHSKDVQYNSPAIFDIALLTPSGEKTTSGKVEIKFMHDQGRYYWTYEEGSGWTRHDQERWKVLQKQVIDLKDIKQVQFQAKWGQYRLLVKDLKTGETTLYAFRAGWSSYGGSQQAVKPDQLDIQLDKTRYSDGDTIKAIINAPVAGDVTISVDADKPLWTQTISVSKGKQEIAIPIKAQWQRHDLYITSVLTANLNGYPKRYFGIKPLKLDREDRKLTVSMNLPDVVRPMKTVPMTVKVGNMVNHSTSSEGHSTSSKAHSTSNEAPEQKTWVTLSLVDKGIVNLSRYRPQDPFNFFYSQRRYQADVIDLYSRLYDLRPDPFATSRFGSDLMAQAENRNDDLAEIKTITWMSQAVEVVNGEATFNVPIPDYNGQAQVIATAFNDSQYGQFVSEQVIADSTIIELGAPKFFVPKDTSTLAVDIINKSDVDQTYHFEISTDNNSVQLTNSSASKQSFKLANDARTSFRFPIAVKGEFDQLANTIQLSIKNDLKAGSSDAEEIDISRTWSIPIRPSTSKITKRFSLVLKQDQAQTIDESYWENLHGHSAMVTASYSPVIDIDTPVQSLFQYPYGCSEQVTSTAFPFLLKSPSLQQAKQEKLAGRSVEDALTVAAQKLTQRQFKHGGFGYWDNAKNESTWVTVYATDFLLNLHHFDKSLISQDVVNKALERVTDYVKKDISGVDDTTLAYAMYIAASNGKVTWADVDNAQKRMKDDQTSLTYLYTAVSYLKVGDLKNTLHWLEMAEKSTQNEPMSYYDSTLRSQALSAVILDTIKDNPSLEDIAYKMRNNALEKTRQLSDDRQWLSTQENYALVLAGLISQSENSKNVTLLKNGQTHQASGVVSLKVQAGDTLTNSEAKPLLVNLVTHGYPKDLAQVPSTIKTEQQSKSIYYLDKSAYQGESIKVGERLLVVIDLETQTDYYDALLVDLIPMGFTLENPNLNQGPNIQGILSDKWALTELEHSEYRHDRYVAAFKAHKHQKNTLAYIIRAEAPGRYQMPSAHLESMYDPESRLWIAPSSASIFVEEASVEKAPPSSKANSANTGSGTGSATGSGTNTGSGTGSATSTGSGTNTGSETSNESLVDKIRSWF